MANARVEKYIVRDMIPTMSEDLGFTDHDIPRVLAAYALYMDKGFEIRVVGSRASVTFVRGAKQVEGGEIVEEPSRRIKELESKLGEQEKEKVRPKLSEERWKPCSRKSVCQSGRRSWEPPSCGYLRIRRHQKA